MAPPQPGYGTTAKRKRSSASLTETKQDLRPEQDHSRSGSAPSTSWAECRDKKGSAPSRRKEMSLDIPLYRTSPITALIRHLVKNCPGHPFHEAIATLGKKTLLFCGFGSCGNDTLSISLVQILLNFVVGESTDASENPERVQRMSQIFPTSHFQKRWESL